MSEEQKDQDHDSLNENSRNEDSSGKQENGDSHEPEVEFHSGAIPDKDGDIVLASEVLPEKVYILPMVQRPIFPGMMIPLIFSGEVLINEIKAIYEKDGRMAGAVLTEEMNEENPWDSKYYNVGTAVRLHRLTPVSEDSIQVLVQGYRRFRYVKELSRDPYPRWRVEYLDDTRNGTEEELKAYTVAILNTVKELLKLNPLFQEQLKMLMGHLTFEKPGVVMDLIASMTTAEAPKLQEVLETLDLYERANRILVLLEQEIEVSRLQEKIKSSIEEKISKQQKQFFLQEQLKIIKKELGLEKDDKTAEIEKFEKRFAKLKLNDEVKKVVDEEMEKFRLLEPASPEHHVTRNYLDWLSELPWGIYSEDSLELKQAREILEAQHYGLKDVKERILEFISTAIKKRKLSGSIICLVGPPGVGKTSVGRSIADAVGRKFYRFSVGGMRDEAEIKGHRRTYIGAMPGKIIQSLRRCETANPVIMIDEIDKLGVSFQGDPASAMLEVLDPEQNRDFLDHYLDVRFDLSQVMFIATANQLDTIPAPLLDRMEIIKLSGYILEEKREIAKRYLIPKQREEHGLSEEEIDIQDSALDFIIDRYAREAGVRGLENQIKKIMRRTTMILAEGESSNQVIARENTEEFLGSPVFPEEELYNKDVPGVALGLAWTSMGGATLYIEATGIIARNPGFNQTGQLGKVMEESSIIAYTYIRSRVRALDPDNDFFDNRYVHLHVPAGATPKDGPSAGITMACALFSLAFRKPLRNGVAMTGELTLTGKVLPIGGLKEKTIAARRVGVYELIFPGENKKDFDELPDYLKDGVTVHFADYFDDVITALWGEEWKSFRIPEDYKLKDRPKSE